MVRAPTEAFLSAGDYWRTEDRIVRAAAARGHVVIVGRASQVIMADLHDVLHVHIIAPFEKRVAYVCSAKESIATPPRLASTRKIMSEQAIWSGSTITTQTMRICTTWS